MKQGNQRLDDFAGRLSARIDELRPKPININREAFEDFAQHVPSIIWTANQCGQVTYLNRAFKELTGCQGADYLSVFHPEDAARSKEAWRTHASSSRGVYTNHARIKGLDNEYHWIVTRASPVLNHDGTLSFWIGSTAVMAAHASLIQQVA